MPHVQQCVRIIAADIVGENALMHVTGAAQHIAMAVALEHVGGRQEFSNTLLSSKRSF